MRRVLERQRCTAVARPHPGLRPPRGTAVGRLRSWRLGRAVRGRRVPGNATRRSLRRWRRTGACGIQAAAEPAAVGEDLRQPGPPVRVALACASFLAVLTRPAGKRRICSCAIWCRSHRQATPTIIRGLVARAPILVSLQVNHRPRDGCTMSAPQDQAAGGAPSAISASSCRVEAA
jgi:hypothetical protein